MTVLRAIRGDDFQLSGVWNDPDGDPINLTGYTVTFTVTVNGDVQTYSIGSGVTVTPLSGRIDILIEDDVTAEWGSDGSWRLSVTSSGDLVTTLGRGILKVS